MPQIWGNLRGKYLPVGRREKSWFFLKKKIQLQQTILKSSRIHFKWGFSSIRKRLKCGNSSLFLFLNTDFFSLWISHCAFLLLTCHCYSVFLYEANWLQMSVVPQGSLSPCTIWSSNSFPKSLLVPWSAHQIPELVPPAQKEWQPPGADCRLSVSWRPEQRGTRLPYCRTPTFPPRVLV